MVGRYFKYVIWISDIIQMRRWIVGMTMTDILTIKKESQIRLLKKERYTYEENQKLLETDDVYWFGNSNGADVIAG